MSSASFPDGLSSTSADRDQLTNDFEAAILRAVKAVASLRVTCVLFVLAMALVFVGSLAQSRRDINPVMKDYFRTFVARVTVQDLFPPSLFGQAALAYKVDDFGKMVAERIGFAGFPFPGGWTIGFAMLANLIAAHSLKFRIQSSGNKLFAGVMLVALSLIMIAAVVITGNQQKGVEFGKNTLLTPDVIWSLMLAMMAVTGAASLAVAFLQTSSSISTRIVMAAVAIVFLGVFLYFLLGGDDARLNLWSMRILWQLLKGSACALVLLLGANLIFGRRGGIAAIHFGVALLMISELWTGIFAKENMLRLSEGESSSFVRDIRENELAIITDGIGGKEKVVVIPDVDLVAALSGVSSEASAGQPVHGKLIHAPSLPFDLGVRSYFDNSSLRARRPGDEKIAEDGLASFAMAAERPPVTGMEEENNEPCVLVDLVDRESGKTIQTLLVAQNVSEFRGSSFAEVATVDGRDYRFYLRWQRNYRDYDVTLKDVSRTTYVGSATPRDFRSVIEIRDRKTGTKEEFAVWMNNPLRYHGETFYQSGYTPMPDGNEATTLSVVSNAGWMLPYIACMVVAFGMSAQFGQTLIRFLDRRFQAAGAGISCVNDDGDASDDAFRSRPGFAPAGREVPADAVGREVSKSWIGRYGFALAMTALFAAWFVSKAREPKPVEGSFALGEFAKLPIAWSGRVQPIDSMARTQLLMASHKSVFEGELDAAELDTTKRREIILKEFAKAWPNVKIDPLKDFRGSYPEWIKQMSEMTSSGEAAIEARMRPVMVVKMPAVRWLLDVVTRPEVAARHRVVRIDNDTILAALGLVRRHGLTYSPAEIQPKIKELDGLLQSARKKQQEKKSSLLTTEERRVVALGDSLMRIDQMQQLFMVRESDGLLESYVDAWRVLRLLGEETAVNAVPTGSGNEQRAWESVVGANTVHELNKELKNAGIESLEQLQTHLREKLPLAMVRESVIGTWKVLEELPASSFKFDNQPESIQSRAAQSNVRVDESYLRRVLDIISTADQSARPDEVAAAVTPEQARGIASERVSSLLFGVFETLRSENPDDKRLAEIRTRLQSLGTADSATISDAMTKELTALVWTDLQKRVGELLPAGKCSDTFNQAASSFTGILDAWKAGNAKSFNDGLASYQQFVSTSSLPHLQPALVRKEAWFNDFEPFYTPQYAYITVIVLSFSGWLFYGAQLRRASLGLLVLGFIVHTAALYWRMEFSGRPPVTNLYSSAIFIGWAAIVAAFLVELILKNGIGNVLGGAIGAGSLVIAHYLAREESRSLDGGDNLGVMQAVLDTTFWLATHVVCITLGYAASFLAGFIGLLYCIQAVIGRSFGSGQSGRRTAEDLKLFGKLNYGTLCFAIFFSLVGTVLGGLWADDSWGRFWGWDPKENGALMIVLWNAVILHARWDKMVGDYGTAVLSMLGNAVTAWSWFGVNGLQAGLHSYGFTEGRLLTLGYFILAQTLIVILFTAMSGLVRRQSQHGSV